MQKEIDTESSTSINEENMDDNNASEELASHQNSTGVIDHTYDDNVINLLNTEEEADVTSIQSINRSNDTSMHNDENLSINIMQRFNNKIIMNMYLLDQNMIQQNEEYVVIKTLFLIYYYINQEF